MNPFHKAPNELPDRVFIALDERARGDGGRGGKIDAHFGDIRELSKAVPARQDRELGVDHRGVQSAGAQRVVDVGDAAYLNHGEIPLPFDRPLRFDVPQSEIGR